MGVSQIFAELSSAKILDAPIVTQIEQFEAFYKAEEYHNNYFKRHPEQPYCKLVIAPKIAKLRKYYIEKTEKALENQTLRTQVRHLSQKAAKPVSNFLECTRTLIFQLQISRRENYR